MARPLLLALLALTACAAPARLSRGVGADHPAPDAACWSKFEVASSALSRFYGRPVSLRASVVLPPGFQPEESAAVCYHVPDLGEDPAAIGARLAERARRGELPPLVVVVLDPRGSAGHHLFADSVNDGPRGEALIADLIPALETSLFARGSAAHRYVSGRGLGGWSAVHLQVAYPHAFDGCWALDPDPLDARAFYGADLAAPEPRAARLRSEPLEARVACFAAALGPRGNDGRPLPLVRGSGELDPDVARRIAQQDPLSRVSARGSAAQARIDGKLHVAAAAGDRLGRDDSVQAFGAALCAQGVGAEVLVLPRVDAGAWLLAAWTAMAAAAVAP